MLSTWASCQIRKIAGAHALGMPGTLSPPPRVSDPDMHHGTCVTHVPWCMPGSLTKGFLWSGPRGKRSRHSRRMRNSQFYVSGKRPIAGPLSLGHQWILLTKESVMQNCAVSFVDSLNKLLINSQFDGDLRRLDAHVTVTVMLKNMNDAPRKTRWSITVTS